jgi:UrcA family protein
MKILLPLAALAAGFLATPSAYAEPASRTVRIADLRLNTHAGVAALDRRLHLAAREVCAAPAAYERSQRRLVADCVAATVAAATPQRSAVLATVRIADAVELSAR